MGLNLSLAPDSLPLGCHCLDALVLGQVEFRGQSLCTWQKDETGCLPEGALGPGEQPTACPEL